MESASASGSTPPRLTPTKQMGAIGDTDPRKPGTPVGRSPSAQDRTSRVAKPAALLFLALLFGAAAWSVAVDNADITRMPTPAEIGPGNRALMAAFQPGDVISPFPRWFANARGGLDRVPILMGTPSDDWELYQYSRVFLPYATSQTD